MNLWIRSQDKTALTKASNLEIIIKTNGVIEINNINFREYNCLLGTYETKERALEILGEIQNLIMPKSIMKFSTFYSAEDLAKIQAENSNYIVLDSRATIERISDQLVYEMPKE